MSPAKPQKKPSVPRPNQIEAIIRSLAEHSEFVVLTDHAMDRMEERGFMPPDLFRILRCGHVSGDIEPGKEAGEWVCKMVFRLKGNRDAGAVTAVVQEKMLIIITMEWEDLK